MFGLGPMEITLIVVAALLIFGPSKLPELGKALGNTITSFKKGIKESTEAVTKELAEDKKETPSGS
ncbi:MAG: twin-arginine translocase TatA/TatE family subunit [Armatimonadetes bacterium]|nr:twin-arginine translocase TatA/TatE family subunit [Armatimonadota bacterium]